MLITRDKDGKLYFHSNYEINYGFKQKGLDIIDVLDEIPFSIRSLRYDRRSFKDVKKYFKEKIEDSKEELNQKMK